MRESLVAPRLSPGQRARVLYSLAARCVALHAWERDADNSITAIGSGLAVVVVFVVVAVTLALFLC